MKSNVVIVEDDTWLADSYARSLRRAGYDMHHASSALEAIDVIDTVRPQVVVLDVLLTGVTALALLHELQSHADLANIPIILATSAADMITLDDVAGYGVREIIDKSTMHPDDIVAAVRGVA